jgi:hypothetical protein
LPFKCNLQRYNAAVIKKAEAQNEAVRKKTER